MKQRLGSTIAVGLALIACAGCSMGFNTLGGRETCWPKAERRAPSEWRGILRITEAGARLDTPEGEVIPLRAGALEVHGTALTLGTDVVARAGDDVTVFGGAGADGVLVACGIEENRGPA